MLDYILFPITKVESFFFPSDSVLPFSEASHMSRDGCRPFYFRFMSWDGFRLFF